MKFWQLVHSPFQYVSVFHLSLIGVLKRLSDPGSVCSMSGNLLLNLV